MDISDFYLMANINNKNIFDELNNDHASNTKFDITLFQFS